MALVKKLSLLALGITLCWTAVLGQEEFYGHSRPSRTPWDSLASASWKRLPAQPAAPHRLNWNSQTLGGLTLLLVAGGSALYCHRQAEQAYHKYLRSGNYSEIRRLYRRAQRYDRLTGWAYALAELGFVITVLSFDR